MRLETSTDQHTVVNRPNVRMQHTFLPMLTRTLCISGLAIPMSKK